MKLISQKNFLLIFLLLFFFVGIKSKNIYPWIKIRINYLPKKINLIKLNKFKNCEISSIDQLPEKYSIIVGHAYGSPNKKNDFISPKIEKFIISNKYNIENIFFTGDIFSVPTKEKWDKLYSLAGNSINMIIAPGNHDFGINNKFNKKLFEESKIFRSEFPYKFTSDKIDFIIEDSISNKWEISTKTLNLINQIQKDKKAILLRHNIPVKELLALSNSMAGYGNNLPSKRNLNKLIIRQTLIISGDGGAFSNLPRLYCHEFGKLKFIVNGIGELPNDKILIIHKNSIFKYDLDQNQSNS